MANYRTALLISAAPIAFASTPYRAPETPAGAERAAELVVARDGDTMLQRSADSAAMVDYWDLVDALVDGADAVRKAGTKFLPQFADEEKKDYDFRLSITKYTNIFRDIVESLASKPFEQEVSLVQDENKTTPPAVMDFIENVDGSGNHITQFASATFFNGIANAIDWIFVDYSVRDPKIVTIADAQRAGIRPYWSHVLGRNVLDPKSKVINGKETLTYIKIYEPGKPDHVREFERLDNGTVVWRLWVKTDRMINGKTQYVIESEGTVSIGVIPLVPFATGRRDGRTFRYFPAMRDAADLQVELYQQESGLKFNKTMGAYSMLTGDGVKPVMDADGKTPKKISVGPMRILYGGVDGNGNAGSWKFIQPSAEIMKFLAEDVKETIDQLRELGRQPTLVGNITVITAARSASKGKSAVGAWALALKDTLENALVITCMWLAIRDGEYSPQVNVYNEFDDFKPEGDLDALKDGNSRGKISDITYREEFRRRGILSADVTEETEEQRLLDQVPSDTGDDIGDVDALLVNGA